MFASENALVARLEVDRCLAGTASPARIESGGKRARADGRGLDVKNDASNSRRSV